MDAQAILDAYVHDVARELPPRKRDDVAFELRGLLTEELQERVDAAGRAPDSAMAMEVVRAHGRPAEVAARYHAPFTIIEPSDTRTFVLSALAGAAAIAIYEALAPVDGLRSLAGSMRDEGAFLGWLGILVIGFAAKNLVRLRWPAVGDWKPRAIVDPDRAGRLSNVLVALAAIAALGLYLAPVTVLGVLPAGIVDPNAFVYTDDFLSPLRMPWLAVVLAAFAVLHLVVASRGSWTRLTRWIDVGAAISIALQLGWHIRYGDVFTTAATELSIRPIVWLVVVIAVLYSGLQLYREWHRVRPTPSLGPAVLI